MLSRIVRLRHLCGGQSLTRRYQSGWVDGGDHATHNDLPIPEGDWKDLNARRNLRYNLIFGSGIVALVASSYLLFFSGTVNFNATRPDHWNDEHSECKCDQ